MMGYVGAAHCSRVVVTAALRDAVIKPDASFAIGRVATCRGDDALASLGGTETSLTDCRAFMFCWDLTAIDRVDMFCWVAFAALFLCCTALKARASALEGLALNDSTNWTSRPP
jgi:hypothetical protein